MRTCKKCKAKFKEGTGNGNQCNDCHRAQVYEARERRRLEDPEGYAKSVFDNRLWSLFRLRREDYDAILDAQGHVCAVCKQPNRHKKGFHVDHDHSCCPGQKSCGKCVRGVLCNGCNAALGHAEDSPDRLRQLIQYLEYSRLPTE